MELFEKYLTDIAVSDVAKNRISAILSNLSTLYANMSFQDIFLCEIMNNGVREYTSLWLFSDSHVVECKNFLNQDDFDLAGIKNNVLYFNIKKSDYDNLENPIPNSNISISILFNNARLSCNLIANGENCKYAINIARKYFLANMVTVR